jgi:hypothetical protein
MLKGQDNLKVEMCCFSCRCFFRQLLLDSLSSLTQWTFPRGSHCACICLRGHALLLCASKWHTVNTSTRTWRRLLAATAPVTPTSIPPAPSSQVPALPHQQPAPSSTVTTPMSHRRTRPSKPPARHTRGRRPQSQSCTHATAICHTAAENSSIGGGGMPPLAFLRRKHRGIASATMACLPLLPARRSTKCQAGNVER